jgi:hypothetical protein
MRAGERDLAEAGAEDLDAEALDERWRCVAGGSIFDHVRRLRLVPAGKD